MALADEFDVAPRTATVFIIDDLERACPVHEYRLRSHAHTAYWKNHSNVWPVGAETPDPVTPGAFGPGNTFYNTTRTYLQVITIEEDGNAFYILGRQ